MLIEPGFRVTHIDDGRAYLVPDGLSWSTYDSWWDEYRHTSITDHCVTSDGHTECLDLRPMTNLRSVPTFFDELRLVAVQENGGWVCSVFGTLEHFVYSITSTFTPQVIQDIIDETEGL